MGLVSSFWASQEGGYPLGDIEREELENVSLFNLFLPKKPQNGQLTHYQNLIKFCYCAVTQLCATLWDPHGWQHARLPCPSPSPRACSNTCPFSWWCQPAFSSPVIPFSSCPQAFPASEFFSNESALCIRWPKHWSFSFSISTSNEYSGLISFEIDLFYLLAVLGTLTSLPNTIVQKHQFFSAQPSLWSNSHIHTWLLANHSFDYMDPCWQSNVSAF